MKTPTFIDYYWDNSRMLVGFSLAILGLVAIFNAVSPVRWFGEMFSLTFADAALFLWILLGINLFRFFGLIPGYRRTYKVNRSK